MPKTPLDKFAKDVEKILADYAEDTAKTVQDLSKDFAKKGAKAVKNASAQEFGSGRYSKGWTATVEQTRFGAVCIIHNKTPGLPHLLEKGHAKRGGGRVPGRVHIAPVEQEISKEFLKAVQNDL